MSKKSNLREAMELNQERRSRHLKNLIEESIINILHEQEQAQQPEMPPPVATPNNQAQATEEQVPKQYTVDDMIDELNAIRGGKSFSDPEVYGKLVTFFKNLSEEQRSTLDGLLTQIAELVTGVGDAPQDQQQGQTSAPTATPQGAPQSGAPMPGAQPAVGAAGVGVA